MVWQQGMYEAIGVMLGGGGKKRQDGGWQA